MALEYRYPLLFSARSMGLYNWRSECGMVKGTGSCETMESSLGSSKASALGGGTLKRIGEGYVCCALDFLFPSELEPFFSSKVPILSRFFSDSFFSRCSLWIGGAGVREAWREMLAGLSGDGTLGAEETSSAGVAARGATPFVSAILKLKCVVVEVMVSIRK